MIFRTKYRQISSLRTQIMNSVVLSMMILFFNFNSAEAASSVINDETIFSDAKFYTVKIKTRINYPFIEDQKMSSIGTGFLIDKKLGLILTNAHVVGHSKSDVSAMFYGESFHKATKVYVDPILDLAIIKLPPKIINDKSTEAKLDCDSTVSSGHPVGAYGHPWDLSFTSTRGIISGTTYLSYADWIQTDAPINAGNSGGPLIALSSGKVIGISSAKLSGKKVEGLNFALPIKYACKVVKLVKSGIDPSPIDLGLEFFETEETKPLKVAKIFDSNKTDLQAGDILIGIDGKKSGIKNPFQLIHHLRGERKETVLNVKRQGKLIDVMVANNKMEKVLERKGLYFSGMIIAPNTYSDRDRKIKDQGWLVHFVDSGSSAESEKIKEWDMLLKIDNIEVGNFDDVFQYIKDKRAQNKKILLMLKRTSNDSSKMNDYHEVELIIEDEMVIKV